MLTIFSTFPGVSSRLVAQDDYFDDEVPEFSPGLVARRWLSHAERTTGLVNVDEEIHFDWTREAFDQRLTPSQQFAANWTGLLDVKDDGLHRIRVYFAGSLTIKLDAAKILQVTAESPQWASSNEVELEFGRHQLEVDYSADGVAEPRLGLFWEGPTFQLEPISSQHLLHATDQAEDVIASLAASNDFEVGKTLSRALRCSACHEFGLAEEPLRAPALTHLSDNLRPSWLVSHLSSATNALGLEARKMPTFRLPKNSAAAIAAALFDASEPSERPEDVRALLRDAAKKRKKKDPEVRTDANPAKGASTFAAAGCLACHQVGQLGEKQDLEAICFGGGDLALISPKRTANFLARWLEDPSKVNSDHRMPPVALDLNERLDLVAYLQGLGSELSRNDTQAWGDKSAGAGLIAKHRCAACHKLPESLKQPVRKTPITPDSDWKSGCLGEPDAANATPGFQLSPEQVTAIQIYYKHRQNDSMHRLSGEQVLAENNCLSCHSRGIRKGIASQLTNIVAAHPDLAPRLAGLTPPSITGVGDKLNETALRKAIERKTDDLRPWLDVRMPKFSFSTEELDALTDYFISHDRIPSQKDSSTSVAGDLETQLAAGRLVTSEGFGCQSCHAIGDMEAPKVDLKAKGTNLTMLGDRIRPTWFQRWVRNPSRIVPRMEMPAIQTAVKGVLHDDLDAQLDALWTTLNTPGYRPPRPNPVRTVRSHNAPNSLSQLASAGVSEALAADTHVVTCVIETPSRNYLRPLVVGLANRHNILFDLAAGELSAWWIGDTAKQYTRGKTWYWEPGSELIGSDSRALEAISIVDAAGQIWKRNPVAQFAVEFDSLQRTATGVQWSGRMHFESPDKERRLIPVVQKIEPAESGFTTETTISTGANEALAFDTANPVTLHDGQLHFDVASHAIAALRPILGSFEVNNGKARLSQKSDGNTSSPSISSDLSWRSTYSTTLPADYFPEIKLPPQKRKPKLIDTVPGFEAVQLPLPFTEMPVSFAWDEQGNMYSGSLKGRVLKLLDLDKDELRESYEVISDELPAPYGMRAVGKELDVLTKYGLLRLTPPQRAVKDAGTEAAEHIEAKGIWNSRVIADGWGYTADYHDWAVGLEMDSQGNYYVAIPCQQDDRSEAAAYLRGHALKLIPNLDSEDQHRAYRIESFAAGLRFPMGIALDSSGELFVTDNQGNYNPFNELNHLTRGSRYGFINKLENKDGFSPPFESPAINIPHPWVRSVNGMCFLNTPTTAANTNMFGPFEGHILGCEMNGRSLVRMTLQRVGEQIQGAAYEFSRPPLENETTFEGPIVCEVAPNADIYVGNLHDSGWGGGNNTGSVVRLRLAGEIPLGIREVRATKSGFDIAFTKPVAGDLATRPESYQIRSYRRVSTPVYGGDDEDIRIETVQSASVSEDGRLVSIQLDDLRGGGCVYEITIASIGPEGIALFPRQAHYTMRQVPE